MNAPDRPGPELVVLGAGDLFGGDHGAGLFAIEALVQEDLTPEVEAFYLAGNHAAALSYLHGARAAALVFAAWMPPGCGPVLALSRQGFMTFAARDERFPSPTRAMAQTLAWGEAAGCLPGDMLVVLVRVEREQGVGLSSTGRRGVRRAVALVRDFARRLSVLPPALPGFSRVYAIPWLNMVL